MTTTAAAPAHGATYTIGEQITCSDGKAGTLTRVVIDPVATVLTHVVLHSHHRHSEDRHSEDRLVPIALVGSVGTTVVLDCTLAEAAELPPARETMFMPVSPDRMGYRSDQLYSWPYYGIARSGLGNGTNPLGVMGWAAGPHTPAVDRVPLGEVEISRGDSVHASDGHIGKVRGLVIDTADHHVTHVLLEEGHLWRHKQVTIPVRSVVKVDDGITVDLTKAEVGDLPLTSLTTQG